MSGIGVLQVLRDSTGAQAVCTVNGIAGVTDFTTLVPQLTYIQGHALGVM
jgi:hypothetical protein